MDRRDHPRFHTRFEAFCFSGREEGEGRLRDVSYSGAQVTDVDLRPPLGTKVQLTVLVGSSAPFELSGAVVRHLDDGFALEFAELPAHIRSLVDDVAAIVEAAD